VTIRVLLFGALAELARPEIEEFVMGDDATAGDVIVELRRRVPAIAQRLDTVAVAVNLQYVARDHRLKSGDEVAVIPPVSGG
jgi:molybdopterin converting factor subunit 1